MTLYVEPIAGLGRSMKIASKKWAEKHEVINQDDIIIASIDLAEKHEFVEWGNNIIACVPYHQDSHSMSSQLPPP